MKLLRQLVLALALLLGAAADDYRFTLDGKPFNPSILPVRAERKGKPVEGDISRIADIPIVLGEPSSYALRTDGTPIRRIFSSFNGGPETCVAVAVRWDEGTGLVDDPLRQMTAEERSRLWGAAYFTEPELWPSALHGLDGTKTAVHFHLAARPDGSGVSLPRLPPDLHYLSVVTPSSVTLANPEVVRPLHKLRYLKLDLGKAVPLSRFFDTGRQYPIRHLDVRGADFDLFPPISELRFLKLREMPEITSAKGFNQYWDLRVLKIDGSGVKDLRPLVVLRELRLLSAHDTPLEHLPPPEGLPNLRDLRIADTPLLQNRELVAKYRAVASVSVKNWEPSIRAFEKWDAENELPERPVLFVGSSSIRFWKLKKAFPDYPTLNRGFGGSELSDSLQYFDRIVLPYRPRVVLLYAGDNDVGRDESAEQVIADFRAFANKVRSKLPKAHFAFLPIKPSPARWDLWPEMQKANAAIREITESHPRLHYLDTVTPMLGEDGRPRGEFFLGDGLHMNARGYEAWNKVVAPWLKSLE